MARLTDKTFAQSTAITPTTLIHIVYTGDPSQNPAGSSYKVELNQIAPTIGGYQYYSEIVVSNIELLTLFSLPVTILSSPGAGKYYDFKVYMEYNYGTVAYDVINSVRVVDDNFTQMSSTIDLTQINNEIGISYGLLNGSIPNSSLKLYASVDPTVGDGTMKIKIYYNIVDFG